MVPGSALLGRLPCAARASGLAHNSLHSLRSFRSDRRAKSELEAREYARAPSRCAAQPFTNRPTAARPAGRLHRDRCAPRQWATSHSEVARTDDGRFVRGRERSGADQARAEACFKRASSTDSAPLFDHSERSERREFGAAEPRSEQRGQSARRADPGTMSTAAGRATAARQTRPSNLRYVPIAAATPVPSQQKKGAPTGRLIWPELQALTLGCPVLWSSG